MQNKNHIRSARSQQPSSSKEGRFHSPTPNSSSAAPLNIIEPPKYKWSWITKEKKPKFPSAYLNPALGHLNLNYLQGSQTAAIWGHLADKMIGYIKNKEKLEPKPNILMAAIFNLKTEPSIIRKLTKDRISTAFGCGRPSMEKWMNIIYPIINKKELKR
jgi:hypothetical protein